MSLQGQEALCMAASRMSDGVVAALTALSLTLADAD